MSSDNLEKQEQTEDMTFRETVRSVRSFMGWDYIPVFESDLSEPDKSNNPWRGKHPRKPARISVAMPPDDWICRKLERLNTTVAEGYPSRAQDQFIKIPKSQSRWYQMHTLRHDGPHRYGKSLFSWSSSEAKVNSQFPRIIKASSYPPSGPPSRPISQEYLLRWERCGHEGSYVVNSAAEFNRCTSELQERIASNVNFLCSKISKGKAPKDVTESLKDIKDLAFHQNISIAMQHLADSLFVHLANHILLRRDSYLEFVKPGVKPDTWNLLRNAPMFGYGLFPDSVLNTAEQDITKHESSGVAPGPGPGAPSTPIGEEIIDIGLMTRERIKDAPTRLNRNNNLRDNFLEIEAEAVHVVELVLVFPNPAASSLTNDNYSCFPTERNLSAQGLDVVVKNCPQEQILDCQSYKQNVSCIDVVNHVPTVIIQGQPQKKGLRPGFCLNRIKLVEGASCVNPCLFAPSVPNVPHVATEISVGGRLQSFWQVCKGWVQIPGWFQC